MERGSRELPVSFRIADYIIYSFLKGIIAPGRQTNAIYADLQKSLNKTDYDLLIARLDKLGVRNYLFSWLFSYVDQDLIRKKLKLCF